MFKFDLKNKKHIYVWILLSIFATLLGLFIAPTMLDSYVQSPDIQRGLQNFKKYYPRLGKLIPSGYISTTYSLKMGEVTDKALHNIIAAGGKASPSRLYNECIRNPGSERVISRVQVTYQKIEKFAPMFMDSPTTNRFLAVLKRTGSAFEMFTMKGQRLYAYAVKE